MKSVRVLLAGESWASYGIHVKGAAAYTTAAYEEGAEPLIRALRSSNFEVTYLPNHTVVEQFPFTCQELLDRYDVVVLSDLPSDSLLLPRAVFVDGETRPNRLTALKEFTSAGGGLLMIGGYMSFAGFEGRARYGMTPLADALPVEVLAWDDRVETPEGVRPGPAASHVVLEGIDEDWPYLLGYNLTKPREGSTVVLTAGNGDPLLVVRQYGAGRSAAFTSDCSPHWGSPQFVTWRSYQRFWAQLVGWLAGPRAEMEHA